jgi:hypothetical protein
MVKRFDFHRLCALTNKMPTFFLMCWIEPLAAFEDNFGMMSGSKFRI